MVDDIGCTIMGKVNKKALRQRFWPVRPDDRGLIFMRLASLTCRFGLGLLPGRALRARPRRDGTDWPGYGGIDENHYSPLKDINDHNVGRWLGLAWYQDIEGGSSLTAPIAVDGILYYASGYSVVHAVDAATGHELWTWRPAKLEGRRPEDARRLGQSRHRL